jgi:hypothetical protein
MTKSWNSPSVTPKITFWLYLVLKLYETFLYGISKSFFELFMQKTTKLHDMSCLPQRTQYAPRVTKRVKTNT